ncbi:hypothetical protein B1F79_03030 [Coxiella-like endosymbiont of Rhipicephalus sanguineus]|uniref:EI24 domain-containing protein n=1 Tax=Coxiella-like endosymbiont of Rhipicephalus sanguineus TaxID=1955402 RepID=UPI0020403B4E|nr:EI24 domain-containing protein [Coxiella-like endosymbiont of Rhipicephalus sanguineus]MBT8506547.1 hypothetical protein [Coxiella-like endosymbiont of Rhipicephalus sanguineus]
MLFLYGWEFIFSLYSCIGLKIYYRNGCDGLNWLLWILFAISFFIIVVYTFTLVGNIISAPFNGFLAEKIEKLETEKDPESSGESILKDIPLALKRQV